MGPNAERKHGMLSPSPTPTPPLSFPLSLPACLLLSLPLPPSLPVPLAIPPHLLTLTSRILHGSQDEACSAPASSPPPHREEHRGGDSRQENDCLYRVEVRDQQVRAVRVRRWRTRPSARNAGTAVVTGELLVPPPSRRIHQGSFEQAGEATAWQGNTMVPRPQRRVSELGATPTAPAAPDRRVSASDGAVVFQPGRFRR